MGKEVKKLLKFMTDDAKNLKGETALAIHDNKDRGPHRSEEIGRAIRAAAVPLSWLPRIVTPRHHIRLGKSLSSDFSRLRLATRRISRNLQVLLGGTSEKSRELFIVIAVLVATTTYQGILSPPGGFWQNHPSSSNTTMSDITSNSTAHSAGQMVMNGASLSDYIRKNSTAFVVSVFLIIACMPADIMIGPYIVISMIALLDTYEYALDSVLPPDHSSVRASVSAQIVTLSVVACLVILFRVFVGLSSAALAKPDMTETGFPWELVRFDEHVDRQSNVQHADQQHTANTEGRPLQALEDPQLRTAHCC
ncbi:hypothetical protein CDL15_Pgr021471 [Punica granatum]|uniref:PGG domain-containing protein n=1 Tax=Punica granatum TaxID=22663 RepID=A0A218XMA9_PUNGR|nr:hypothetical protein CDL15_Pgr021471 [Punica granatum]